MTPTDWTHGKDGNIIETVLAVLLSREHTGAERIRPSVGDGGIDVQIPIGDAWNIHQIKGYTGNMTAARKAHVKKSFESLRAYASKTGLKVNSWSLDMPLDPTKENREWLTEVTAGVAFPCTWNGEIFVNGLSAKYPDVIEYYFGDGKERFDDTIRKVTELGKLIRSDKEGSTEALAPADLSYGLQNLFVLLNMYDPHYSWSFEVRPDMPPAIVEPGVVFQTSSGSEGCYVTYNVRPRYKEAIADRPITITGKFVAESGTEESAALEDFYRYGSPLTYKTLPGSFKADLPGGFGDELGEGIIRVVPIVAERQSASSKLRLQVVDTEGDLLGESIFLVSSTTGLAREGIRIIGSDPAGVLKLDMRGDLESGRFKLDLQYGDFTGKDPAEALPAVRLLKNLRHPNSFRIGLPRGPIEQDPTPIPDVERPDFEGLERLLEALVTIQEHTAVQLMIPDFDRYGWTQASEIIRSALILRGEMVSHPTSEVGLPLATTLPVGSGPHNLKAAVPHIVEIADDEIHLGTMRVYAHCVTIAESRSSTDGELTVLSPFQGSEFWVTLAVRHLPDAPALGPLTELPSDI
jgi:hypothetical protein